MKTAAASAVDMLDTIAVVEAWEPKLGASKQLVTEGRSSAVRLSLMGRSTKVYFGRGGTRLGLIAGRLDWAERQLASKAIGVPVLGVAKCLAPGDPS